jgi:hypothetical protein
MEHFMNQFWNYDPNKLAVFFFSEEQVSTLLLALNVKGKEL